MEEKKKSNSIIVDIDGTISRRTDRDWFDYTKINTDEPIEEVIETVRLFHKDGYKIVFCTARDEYSKNETVSWIKKHVFLDNDNIVPVEIHMRKNNDKRKDEIIKKELYEKHIEPYHNVFLVLDDKSSVCEMWRKMGLCCFQVAFGNY